MESLFDSMIQSSFHVYPAQSIWEFERLCGMLRERQPRRVLEIGSRHGRSLLRIAEAAQPALERLVALDLPGAAWGEADSQAVLVGCIEHLAARWPDRLETRLILADSHASETVAQVAELGPFDFIFVDADHSEAGCQTDLDNYLPLVAPGGFAAVHDIAGNENQVREFRGQKYQLRVPTVWRRLKERHPGIRETRELVDEKSTFGIGLIFP
jgi:predicted O-methyltransferase YrrM